MKSKPIFAALFLLLGAVEAQADPCVIRSTQDILACALQRHPEVVQAKAAQTRDFALERIARQRPNPELESKIVGGGEAGQNIITTENSLLHTLELGGKRGARIRQARAEGAWSKASFSETQELAALHTVLALYRLRQIRSEHAHLRESLLTFDRILRQFRSRPVLPPEQAVSLSVFDLAKDEYALREKQLMEEKQNLKTFLETATGSPDSSLERWLPGPKRSWPKFSSVGRENASSEMQKAEAALKKAEASLALAKSHAWPDFKLGPTVETGTLGGNDSVAVGGTISLPLPLLNLNRGEKAYAVSEIARASAHLEQTRRKSDLERTKLLSRYRSAVKGVSQIRLEDLNRRHHEVEEFFARGLVPSSLVIESHRQFLEITKIVHEQELTAVDALWRLYIIDGRVFEEEI